MTIKGHLCFRLGDSLIDKYATFNDENAYVFIIFVVLHVLIVNNILYVNYTLIWEFTFLSINAIRID